MQAGHRRVHGAAAGLQERLRARGEGVESRLRRRRRGAPTHRTRRGPRKPSERARHAALSLYASSSYGGRTARAGGILRGLICLSSESLRRPLQRAFPAVENPSTSTWITAGEGVRFARDPRGEEPGRPHREARARAAVDSPEQLACCCRVLHVRVRSPHTRLRVPTLDRTTPCEPDAARCPQPAQMLKKTKSFKSFFRGESSKSFLSREETAGT